MLPTLFQTIAQRLDSIEIQTAQTAHLLCRLIPAQCPFERTICYCDRALLHLPSLCKLNPFYEQVVSLQFRALCYLADVHSEDVAIDC